MSWILIVETATDYCGVALSQNGTCITTRESTQPRSHAALLTVFMNECVQEAGLTFSGLDAIAVSNGPGSYTGLRVGLAAAKGVCFAVDKPLITVSTLEAMAAGLILEHASSGSRWWCPMLDARRMEVYTAVYDNQLQPVLEPVAKIMDADSFSDIIKDQYVTFFGNGMAKCRPLLEHFPGSSFDERAGVSLKGLSYRSLHYYNHSVFSDLNAAGPFYLKEFAGSKPPHLAG
ncbi:MAG TPA: tRNA (adenosine(37)-N6)-threonylcarbamoyltransferase complex dimerization subunit type 1 TsaB [Bacteroidia bacterium]|nr:tRNA (adenosine(37)-N6)-threonylcarbamoyltransferase complex dimerization subunit type 1 TsaB [Bacteroidia bacterium]